MCSQLYCKPPLTSVFHCTHYVLLKINSITVIWFFLFQSENRLNRKRNGIHYWKCFCWYWRKSLSLIALFFLSHLFTINRTQKKLDYNLSWLTLRNVQQQLVCESDWWHDSYLNTHPSSPSLCSPIYSFTFMPNTYPFYIHQKDTKYMLLSYEQSTNTYRPINLENVQGISKLHIIKIFHVMKVACSTITKISSIHVDLLLEVLLCIET